MKVLEKLLEVQMELKAPKSNYNSFGKYKYRSCEDILTAVKPVCYKNKAVIYLSDEMVYLGDRYYIKATATFVCIETGEKIENTAYAREEAEKKGMDGSQITGTASSYARKYALNGLLDIDDTKDADTDEYHNQTNNAPAKKPRVEDADRSVEQQDRLELETRCKELGIDLEEPSIKNYIAVSLKKSSGKEELDEKFNLGIYNNVLARLIERKESNK